MKNIIFMCISLVQSIQGEFYYLRSVADQIPINVQINYLPWAGILKVKLGYNKEAVTGIILIAKNYAIGNSDHINKVNKNNIRNRTTAILFDGHKTPWESYVSNYFIHQEYDVTKNTIALLRLDTEAFVPDIMWQPISWPSKSYIRSNNRSIYSIGFTDENKMFEQVISKMEHVNKLDCIHFYQRESLDFKRMWPFHYNCFRASEQAHTCVYDAGMTIAEKETGHWTLIGLSTYGPGCTLPSRFIDFHPYIPWIKATMRRHYPDKHFTRRYNWLSEPGEDWDAKLLYTHFINNSAILHLELPEEEETVNGTNCTNGTYVAYREKGYFKIDKAYQPNIVFYSVTLYNAEVEEYVCIVSTVNCVKKSNTTVIIREGFGREDITDLVKRIPIPKPFGKDPSQVDYLKAQYKPFRKSKTITIWFKFEIRESASIDIKFYGKLKPPEEETTSTSSTPKPTTRTKRTYKPFPERRFKDN